MAEADETFREAKAPLRPAPLRPGAIEATLARVEAEPYNLSLRDLRVLYTLALKSRELAQLTASLRVRKEDQPADDDDYAQGYNEALGDVRLQLEAALEAAGIEVPA